MREYKIGLALGGGAARGLAHIGVVEELTKAGIKPAVIAGTSMGAFVGGAFAADKFEAVKSWAQVLDRRAFTSLLDVGLARGGVVEGQRVLDWLNELGLGQPIEDLPIHYAAVATDLNDGSEIWIKDGSMAAAIRASISVPGILRPVYHDGRWLVDGGLVNQVPVSTCRALGADFVIAVNVGEGLIGPRRAMRSMASAKEAEANRIARVNQILDQMPLALRATAQRFLPGLIKGEPESPGYFDVLTNSLNIMQDRITRSRLAGEPPNVLIAPDVATIMMLDFHRAQEAITAGRTAARRVVGSVREMLAQ
jgi:NTE family protein